MKLNFLNNFIHHLSSIDITWSYTADDAGTWYADGVVIGQSNSHRTLFTTYFTSQVRVLAVHATDTGGSCFIRGEGSNGLITDMTSWRCTTYNPGSNSWKTDPEFDDSSWPLASWRNIPNSIWASSSCSSNAYCRYTFRTS